MGDFLRALSLLTRLPVRARWDDDLLPGRAMAAYPLVGAVIGAVLIGLGWFLTVGIGWLQEVAGGSGAGLSPLLTAALSPGRLGWRSQGCCIWTAGPTAATRWSRPSAASGGWR